jgi:hypothetical protein
MVIKTGTVTPTVAGSNARNITLGFVPNKVEVYNVSTGDQLTWTADMPDAYGFKRVAAGTATYITSLGITPLGDDEGLTVAASDTTVDGNTTTLTGVRGFTIGADTDINVCGETMMWVAFGLGHDSD